jgi:hypothetical protein
LVLQADAAEVEIQQPKKRTFKKFTFRGVDLDALLDMSSDELVELFHARARRRLVLSPLVVRRDFFKVYILEMAYG